VSYQIAKSASIGEGLRISDNTVIYENVIIGKNVKLGRNVSIANAIIGDTVTIEDNTIVGYTTLTGWFSQRGEHRPEAAPPVRIGAGSLVRTHSIVYTGADIGDNCWVGHGAMIREHTVVGHDTSIGTMSDCEGKLKIGSHCSIHSQVHLCAYMTMEDYVFVAPFTVFTNESPMAYRRPKIRQDYMGPTIKFGVQIGVNVVVLPRVTVGSESVIGASSVVTKDIPELSFVVGSPARVRRSVAEEERLPVEIRSHYGRA
jgi:acetyltransferase-like isoleucine patch superfamily enzyme